MRSCNKADRSDSRSSPALSARSTCNGLFSVRLRKLAIYRVADKRDYRTVEGFVPADLSKPLKNHHWRWYDVARNQLMHMAPVPHPSVVADELRAKIPQRTTWHPFGWTSQPTGRVTMKL